MPESYAPPRLILEDFFWTVGYGPMLIWQCMIPMRMV